MEVNRQGGGRGDATLDWAEQARSLGLPPMVKAANTILARRSGILAWYNDHLSAGRVEGINNKIKVLKRVTYGFRDDKHFTTCMKTTSR